MPDNQQNGGANVPHGQQQQTNMTEIQQAIALLTQLLTHQVAPDAMQTVLVQQNKQVQLQLQQNAEQFRLMNTQLLKMVEVSTKSSSGPEFLIESLANSMVEFEYDPNSDELNFDGWFKRYEDLFNKDAASLDDAAKTRLLLRKLNTKAFERYTNFILPKKAKDVEFKDTVAYLSKIFNRQISLFNKRVKCLQLAKNDLDDYITYAGIVNRFCEGFELAKLDENTFKCLIFVCGLKSARDGDVRTRLLSKLETEPNLTVEKLASDANSLLNLKIDTAFIENQPSTSNVNKVYRRNTSKFHRNDSKPTKKPPYPCPKCGADHFMKFCEYRNHKCSNCNQFGHKEGHCHGRTTSPSTSSSAHKGNKYRNRSHRPQLKSNGVFAVNQVDFRSRRKYIDLAINGHPARLQLDCGSDITIISESTWRSIGKPQVSNTNRQAMNASGERLEIISEFLAVVCCHGQTKTAVCYVTNAPHLNLFGLEWFDLFNLWDMSLSSICNQVQAASGSVDFQSEFPDLFKDTLGLCTKTKVKLTPKPGAKPIFRPKRPVPSASIESVDRELQRLESKNVITPIDFSDWAAPIVVVKKPNGTVRICADYSTGLNESIEPNHYPIPLPDDIFAKIAGCVFYTVIDFSDAYLQVEVDDESKMMLSIHTHKGLYRFNRLPPGVRSAPGEFQRIMDQMTTGLIQTCAYLDDVIVGAPTVDELNTRVRAVLQRAQEYGFHLRIEKCKFGLREITYLGHVISANGIRPDTRKIAAILQMPAPNDVSSLRSFLGAVNYYGKFVKDMHSLRKPLDRLLLKNVKFAWTAECQQSFDQFKQILSSDLLLAHYDPRNKIIVAADASNTGIGACIMHQYSDSSIKVVQHASRTLTATERNYSQIEKEACALIFAVTKFHRMIAGRHFVLQTDHQPLLAIFGSKKGIPVHTANRLQRWATTLMAYDFSIKYISTDNFGYADVLSRLISSHIQPDEEYVIASVLLEKEMTFLCDEVMTHLPIDYEMIRQATNKCRILQAVINFIKKGWPTKPNFDDDELKIYFNRRNSLSVVKDVLFFCDRVVIPLPYRRKVLKQLHIGHPGIPRMKSLARNYVYWPKIDDQITDYVKRCSSCATASNMPVKTHLQSWPMPNGPWQRIHVDFCGPLDGLYYFVIVDAHSKWPEIFQTKSITSAKTIEFIENCFERFGLVSTIVSDNGTQFTSAIFRQFCESHGITHLTTAPFHPQSNGQAERFVGTFKLSLNKILNGEKVQVQKALSTFLHCYRSVPNLNCPDGKSPAEIMLGRKLRTRFDLLFPPTNENDFANDQKLAQNRQFNRKHGTIDRAFAPGDFVYARVHSGNTSFWQPGEIVSRIGGVMYSVKLYNSKRVTVNRFHTNQLKRRYSNAETNQMPLPLDILIDSFHLRDVIDEYPIDDLPADIQQPQPGPSTIQPLPATPETECVPAPVPIAQPSTVITRRSTRLQRGPVLPSKFNNYLLF